VDAKFENVSINGGAVTFPGLLIENNYWKELEFVRDQINEGVYGSALRSYGSWAINNMNLINPSGIKELQADLTIKELINDGPTPLRGRPQTRLLGVFYNDFYNDSTPGVGAIGDIQAGVGIIHNGTEPKGFCVVVECTGASCNSLATQNIIDYHEFPMTIGPDPTGSPHRLSIRYDDSTDPPKFIFGFDGMLYTPTVALPSKVGRPKRDFKGISTRIRFSTDSPLSSEGGYISTEYADISFVADMDGDGIPDRTDNCPFAYNPGQLNTDVDDDYGDACDLCPERDNTDTDGDGLADVCPPETGGGTTTQNQNLITVTFNYYGKDTYLVPPDCDGNTVFITDPPIRTNCRRRAPYVMTVLEEANGLGIPGGDWVWVESHASWTITCDLLKIFDESSLKVVPNVAITPMYNFLLGDPGINPDTGLCAEGDICVDTKTYPLFKGTIIAETIPVVTKNFAEIDIKPKTYPNTINLRSEGSVPVAILTKGDFDATKIDLSILKLEGAGVVIIKGKYQASNADVNGDGRKDKIVHFYTKGLAGLTTGSACVTGTYNRNQFKFKGCDFVTIVP
jgi:hypothetical protein